jgi:hypothetical protein
MKGKMSKLKMWNEHPNWEAAEAAWDRRAEAAALEHPIKKLTRLPDMPGITEETAKNLKWKSLKWMITKDKGLKVLRGILKHPFRYGKAFLRSAFQKKPFLRDEDFFFYGVNSVEEFSELVTDKEALLVVGFSYCHKPFECPSGRFNENCIHDADNPVCRQCFIGKCMHALPEKNVVPLVIPTIHYIGGEILKIVHANPGKTVTFMITACEMMLEMFGDWGNMVAIKGIGIRLDGRICNTMKAFELSEVGIKPGLTVVLEPTQERILDLIKVRRA